MSEPELLAYMSGANEDYDLPRWHTQVPNDSLSSSAQAAQSAAQASSYLFSQPTSQLPPPHSATNSSRLPAAHHSPGSSRQTRIAQLVDDDQHYAMNPLPYLAPGGAQLSRSTSLGGAATAASGSRSRRHHLPDDLEGAFSDSATTQRHTPTGLSQPHNALYPQSVAYHQTSAVSGPPNNASSSTPATADPYQDAYFTSPSTHPPKRSQTQHDPSTSSRVPRSPLRATNPSQPLLDPYSPQQQNQYNSSTNPYQYSPNTESRSFQPSNYQSHSRSQSQVKAEPAAAVIPPPPPPPAYSPQSAIPLSGIYSPPYPMDTTSPAPTSSQNLSVQRPSTRSSISQPSTPLSYPHPPPSHSPAHFFTQDHQPMTVEPPPKRRLSGLRRVRDQRDLRPYVTSQPVGRRMDSSGVYLSVCAFSLSHHSF